MTTLCIIQCCQQQGTVLFQSGHDLFILPSSDVPGLLYNTFVALWSNCLHFPSIRVQNHLTTQYKSCVRSRRACSSHRLRITPLAQVFFPGHTAGQVFLQSQSPSLYPMHNLHFKYNHLCSLKIVIVRLQNIRCRKYFVY